MGGVRQRFTEDLPNSSMPWLGIEPTALHTRVKHLIQWATTPIISRSGYRWKNNQSKRGYGSMWRCHLSWVAVMPSFFSSHNKPKGNPTCHVTLEGLCWTSNHYLHLGPWHNGVPIKSHDFLMFVCPQKDAKQCCHATKLECTHCSGCHLYGENNAME